MAMNSISWNPQQQANSGVSKLQTFGNIMGILSAIGSLGSMGSNISSGMSTGGAGASVGDPSIWGDAAGASTGADIAAQAGSTPNYSSMFSKDYNPKFVEMTNEILKGEGIAANRDPLSLGSFNSPNLKGGMLNMLDLYKQRPFTGYEANQARIIDPSLRGGY